ncbi:hypothetical protein PHYPO_G00051400 [Pangasianodon hypophthalmus]|uniref:Uncharacterized protein n=1 Tax=Pangasianodon hypophthalmus TaxID=310915 RepID=A0A5N5M5F3_PANHP|nr:hypothetical protein PHYPO_G00051400 [Pangasianodon hypophthalmus]
MLEWLGSGHSVLPFSLPAQHTAINYSVTLCHLTERSLFCVNENILITILSLCTLPSGHHLPLIKEDKTQSTDLFVYERDKGHDSEQVSAVLLGVVRCLHPAGRRDGVKEGGSERGREGRALLRVEIETEVQNSTRFSPTDRGPAGTSCSSLWCFGCELDISDVNDTTNTSPDEIGFGDFTRRRLKFSPLSW